MARFTLPRDIYFGKGALENLKTLKGKKAIICVGGGSMKRFGFLDRAKNIWRRPAWRSRCSRASRAILPWIPS